MYHQDFRRETDPRLRYSSPPRESNGYTKRPSRFDQQKESIPPEPQRPMRSRFAPEIDPRFNSSSYMKHNQMINERETDTHRLRDSERRRSDSTTRRYDSREAMSHQRDESYESNGIRRHPREPPPPREPPRESASSAALSMRHQDGAELRDSMSSQRIREVYRYDEIEHPIKPEASDNSSSLYRPHDASLKRSQPDSSRSQTSESRSYRNSSMESPSRRTRFNSSSVDDNLIALKESEKLKLLNEQLYAKQLEALNKKESLLLNDPSTFNVDMSSGHESKKGDIFKREEMSLHFDDDQVDTTDIMLVNSNTMITTQAVKLFPLTDEVYMPTKNQRPNGCRTVWIGGLVQNIKGIDVKELFALCGRITHVRMSTRGFCHIRYCSREAVDVALKFSGRNLLYKHTNEIRPIHVDFAKASDDQKEFDLHEFSKPKDKTDADTLISFNSKEFKTLSDNLKTSESHLYTLHITQLKSWLDKGNCNQKTANDFYGVLNTLNTHLKRIRTDKIQYNLDQTQIKRNLVERILNIKSQLKVTCGTFNCAKQQKCWDHFSKAQRKVLVNIHELYEVEYTECKKAFITARRESESLCESEEKKNAIDLTDDVQDMDIEKDGLEIEYDRLRVENNKLKEDLVTLKQTNEKAISTLTSQENLNLKQTITKLKRQVTEMTHEEKTQIIKIENMNKTMITKDEVRIIALISIMSVIYPEGCSVKDMHQFLLKKEVYTGHEAIDVMLKRNTSIFECVSIDDRDCNNSVYKFCSFK